MLVGGGELTDVVEHQLMRLCQYSIFYVENKNITIYVVNFKTTIDTQ